MTDDTTKIDCAAVLEELYTFLDGEVTEHTRTLIERHMGGCASCGEVIEFHYQLKVTIARRCHDDVPAHLRSRVIQALAQERIDPGGIPTT